MKEIEWLLCPFTIIASNIHDYKKVRRSWRERLLSKPWTPLKAYDSVYSPYGYIDDECNPQLLIVSPATYHRLQTEPDFTYKDLNL